MLTSVAETQFIDPARRKNVSMAYCESARVQCLRGGLDRLGVLSIRTGQNRKSQDAWIIQVEVLQNESTEQIIFFPKLMVDPCPESVTVRVAFGIIQEVVAHAWSVRQRLV